jgi:oligogalacturonide transport system permease protein
MWRFLFMKEGVVNKALGVLGVPALEWLGNPKIALFSVSLLTVWQFGSSMVIFLAGLKQIPQELYEAAAVDGVGKVRAFFTITLPMISSIIFFNLLMQMVNAFQEFTGVFVITGGGPVYSTYLYGMLLYDNAFKNYKMGYASALSWVLFIIIMVFTLVAFRASDTLTYYEDGGKI